MSQSKNQITLEAITSEACKALFSGYNMELEVTTELPPAEVHYCGVIGFTGDDLRGTLLLAMGKDPLEAAMPDGSGEGANAHRDWIAELSNQLLGRIKNLLLRRSAEVYLTMPLVLRGEHLSPLPRQQSQGMSFSSDAGCISIWLDAEFAEGYELSEQEDEGADDLPSEGDAMMF